MASALTESWAAVREVAGTLRPADEWRAQLARAVHGAAGAAVAAVFTCPPSRPIEAVASVSPESLAPHLERLLVRILPRVERTGEGSAALRTLGCRPYLPLERAMANIPGLVEAMRAEILQPMGVDTLVNAFLVAPSGQVYGFVGVADRGDGSTLLARCAGLEAVCETAAKTLEGALELAAAVGARLPGRNPNLERLTEREQQVLRLVAGGLTDGEIAARLGISEQTVGTHLRKMYAKLEVHSRTAAAAVLR